MTEIRQILRIVFFESPDFYDKFQQVAKNIEGLGLSGSFQKLKVAQA